jgi:hypothetical protein
MQKQVFSETPKSPAWTLAGVSAQKSRPKGRDTLLLGLKAFLKNCFCILIALQHILPELNLEDWLFFC